MTNFFESDMCVRKRHCLLCRQKTDRGTRWRVIANRVYSTGQVDFDCPYGYPWLEHEPTPEDVTKFENFKPKPGPKVAKKLKQRQFTRKVLTQLLLDNESKLRHVLPLSHPAIEQLNRLRQSEAKGGCRGCRRRKILRRMLSAVNNSTDEEKQRLSETLDIDLSNFSL
jgi:hypothetical protein